MDWLFEANREEGRRSPWISIPGVASIVYRVFVLLVSHLLTEYQNYRSLVASRCSEGIRLIALRSTNPHNASPRTVKKNSE